MMVCTLLEPGFDELRAAIETHETAADAFEVRFDAMKRPADPRRVRGLTAKPLIATCRRPVDGGAYAGPEHERLALLEACLDAGFDHVDVEGPTTLPVAEDRLIRSRHETRGTPSVGAILRMAEESGRNGALFKFAAPTQSFADILTLLTAARYLQSEARRFAVMGLGDFPRALLHLWGSTLVYAGGRVPAPGQPPLHELRRILRHWGDPAQAASAYLVVGDPIDHSLSPRIHNAAFRAMSVPAAFGALRVPGPLDLQMLFEAADKLALRGLSITTPLKDAAFALCGQRTPEADLAQAVNCVRFTPNGPVGHNTDGLGSRALIEELLPNGEGRILVAGTGGAARAIASQLADHDVTIAGRSDDRLRSVAARYRVEAVTLEAAAASLDEYQLIVNATRSLEPFSIHGYHGALFDLHYGPAPTPWERHAAEHNLPSAGGKQLLVEQGAAAFTFWTRRPAPEAAMRAVLEPSA